MMILFTNCYSIINIINNYKSSKKIFNKIREERKELNEKLAGKNLTSEQKKELKADGINKKDKEAVAAYFANKKKLADEAEEMAADIAELKAEYQIVDNLPMPPKPPW